MSLDTISLTASGKFLICGEYVVLDRGVAAALPAGEAALSWVQANDWEFCFRFAGRERTCGLEGIDTRTAGWLSVLARRFGGVPGVVTIDTDDLYRDDGQKWGLGSSGAAFLLLYRLFSGWHSTSDLHRHLQEMNQLLLEAGDEPGSGIDRAVAATQAPVRLASGVAWPLPPLPVVPTLVGLDNAVDTGSRLQKLRTADGFVLQGKLWDRARDYARQAVFAWELGNITLFVHEAQAFDNALEQALRDSKIRRAEQELADLQFANPGWWIRPSGAGGDLAIALPLDPEQVSPLKTSKPTRLAGADHA